MRFVTLFTIWSLDAFYIPLKCVNHPTYGRAQDFFAEYAKRIDAFGPKQKDKDHECNFRAYGYFMSSLPETVNRPLTSEVKHVGRNTV